MTVLPIVDLLILMGTGSVAIGFVLKGVALTTTYNPDRTNPDWLDKEAGKKFVGRSRTGDQLHVSFAGGNNAHCNQRMRLTPVRGTLKFRPGLFCVKCFGNEPERGNAWFVATEVIR